MAGWARHPASTTAPTSKRSSRTASRRSSGSAGHCSARPEVDFGLILPSYRAGASVEGIEAASEAAARLGWHSVFSTDHLLVEPSARSEDYYEIFDALSTVVHVAARQPSLRVGISVLVVPMRNAVELAKELATIDVLSGGRLIVGVGGGWHQAEFGHLGLAERFGQRGAYINEAIAIWRHLWGGATTPFRGRFHDIEDFVFEPLPPQGAGLPIWFGGRAPAALQRAGRLGDGYQSSSTPPAAYAERIPVLREAAASAGRPMLSLSARVRVVPGEKSDEGYALHGTPDQIRAGVAEWEAIGVTDLALYFEAVEPDAIVRQVEWFVREVAAA